MHGASQGWKECGRLRLGHGYFLAKNIRDRQVLTSAQRVLARADLVTRDNKYLKKNVCYSLFPSRAEDNFI